MQSILQHLSRRWGLWISLMALVLSLFGILIWLAARYEVMQLQTQLDHEARDVVSDLHAELIRDIKPLVALQFLGEHPSQWTQQVQTLLRDHRAMVRLEWRDNDLQILRSVDTPYRTMIFQSGQRHMMQPEVMYACSIASRHHAAGYSESNFIAQSDGLGLEIMEMCLPMLANGRPQGYLVVSYALSEILSSMVNPIYTRDAEIAFEQGDGTRLAAYGTQRQGARMFSSQQLLELTGASFILRMVVWHDAPELFPNVLTALVMSMALALILVLLLLVRDMRRRHRAELELADALAFRKAMEDSLVTGLRARDSEGRITYVNPAFCEMVGFSSAELIGCGFPAPYWPPEMVDEYGKRQALRLAGHLSPREAVESEFMRRNGERFPVLIFEAPLINAAGHQTGWMGAVLDISEQRRVEELSRASQERLQATARLAMVGEMASLLSHELNQPLAAISSYASGSLNLLQEVSAQAPALAQNLTTALESIAKQAKRAGKVIKSVHDFVRRRDQLKQAIAPKTLLDNIMPLVILQARKLGVRVEVICPATLPEVLCDRTMVEQVLLNLVRNGMQAMEQQTTPRVLTLQVGLAPDSSAGRWLEFRVADVGSGIDETVQTQLFTPFFTTKAEGMGLGLSLCRTVVEQHGGLLTYTAHRPSGTVFSFTLPQA